MIYYIVTRVELDDDNRVVHTPIGYVTTEEDAMGFQDTMAPFTDWLTNNETNIDNGIVKPGDYFLENPVVYEIGWVTDNLGTMDINKITLI